MQLHKKQNLITRIVHYDGTLFTGSITNVVVGLPLQFYFLGNVTTAATNVPTCLVGFNNKVTVIFAENTFTSSKEAINLPAGNGEKWAILMPQAVLTGGETYSANESHIGTFGRRHGVPRRRQRQPRRWCDLHLSCAVNKHDSIYFIRKRRPSFFEGRLLLFYPSKGAGGWAGHYPKNQYTF